jgi:hypothetical protein
MPLPRNGIQPVMEVINQLRTNGKITEANSTS